MKTLKKLALAWMFAWLPLSGAMAATMPFCGQGSMGMMAVANAAADTMPVSDNGMPCHDSSQDSPEAPQCQHCDLCHVAGALAPPTMPILANDLPSAAPFVAAIDRFSSFIPEQPQRPPQLAPA